MIPIAHITRIRLIQLGAGMLALAFLTGCSAFSGSGKAPASSAQPGNSPLELSIMLPSFKTNVPNDDSPVVREIEKRTNTQLHFEWVPNASYPDKFNITMASGRLPSILLVPDVKLPGFVNAVQSGLFWDINRYLDDYPNLRSANPETLKNSSIDGVNYGIYRQRVLGRYGIVYRKDWLDRVGMKPPQTIDDFYQMLKAFKEKDPDGDGKDDTYGMVMVKWSGQWAGSFDVIKLWFGVPNRWGLQQNKLIPEHETPEYMEALNFMKKLYDEQLINPDFAILDPSRWTDPIVNGEAGVLVDVVDAAARIDEKLHAQAAAGGDGRSDTAYMDVLSGVTGSHGLRTLPTSGYSGVLAFPKSSVKTETELKQILAFLDETNEPDMKTLLGYGLEGRHYTRTGNELELTKNTTLFESEVEGINQLMAFLPDDRSPKIHQTPLRVKQDELQKANESYLVPNPAEPLISKVYAEKGTLLDDIINDARIEYILGRIDESGLKKAFARWRASGGDELVEEMNDLYAKSVSPK